MASVQRDILVVFYYLGSFIIWPDKKGGLIRVGLLYHIYSCISKIHKSDLFDSPKFIMIAVKFVKMHFIALCDKVCQWLAAGRWFSSGTPISSTNKTDAHDIAKILLNVVLNTITLTLYILLICFFTLHYKNHQLYCAWMVIKPLRCSIWSS